MKKRPSGSSDRGASAVLVAGALIVLIGGAALAVDIGALWLDRSTDQKITDSAAAAGALEAVDGGGQEACESALAYVAANASDISTVDDSGCATGFSSSCTSGDFHEVDVNSGQYTIRVTYPVDDAHPLMTSGIVGAGTQSLDSDDGQPCERVAVEMESTRDSLFAQVLGFDQSTTKVHTVATASRNEDGPPINLLVLDRTGCQTIWVRGNGGIIVDAVVAEDDDGNEVGLVPGIAASDSDGSAGCTTDGVIDLDGSGSLLRADGPVCADQLGTHTVTGNTATFTAYEGCGKVQTYAPGTPGCNVPACTPGGGGSNLPKPEPTSLNNRLTRQPVDHRFNCWTDYTSLPAGVGWASDPLTGAQSIDGCDEGDPDHIYDLINAVGDEPGNPIGLGSWENWTDDHSCTLDTSDSDVTINGNVVFDCPTLTLKRHVTVNGNAVFDGNVSITSSNGHLDVNNSLGSPGWAFFRGGTLSKEGQASLTFNYTAVYMAKGSTVAMSGGSGSLTWVAPDSAGSDFDFDDLALWSDSSLVHNWAGQADLKMEGIFFTPRAKGVYTGTSGQNQTDAQWIAWRLEAGGQGRLVVRPSEDRGIPLGNPETTLIR